MKANPELLVSRRSSQPRGLHAQIVRQIGLWITQGQYKPGQTLPDEEKLAKQLDVSRTVIREAIKVLSAKGLVESRPRRGTTVLPFEDWSMLDPDVLAWQESSLPRFEFFRNLTEVRRVVEPAAAAYAAQRAEKNQLENIANALACMKAALDDVDAYRKADLSFHVSILQACRNPFLQPVAHAIGATLMPSLVVTNPDPKRNRRSIPFHVRIFEAIQARDHEAARRAMQVHLDDTWSRIEHAADTKPD